MPHHNNYMNSSESVKVDGTALMNSSAATFGLHLKQGRMPFTVPDKVPWARVGEVLNMKFRASLDTETCRPIP